MPSVVTLQRSNLTEPWGFRLQGGLDFRMPLNIKKIYQGSSAAHSGLAVGDAVVKVGDTDTSKLTHLQAATIFRAAGTQIDIGVEKGIYRPLLTTSQPGKVKFSPATAVTQKKTQTQTFNAPGASYLQKTTTTQYSYSSSGGGPTNVKQVTHVTSSGPPPAASPQQAPQVGFSDY